MNRLPAVHVNVVVAGKMRLRRSATFLFLLFVSLAFSQHAVSSEIGDVEKREDPNADTSGSDDVDSSDGHYEETIVETTTTTTTTTTTSTSDSSPTDSRSQMQETIQKKAEELARKVAERSAELDDDDDEGFEHHTDPAVIDAAIQQTLAKLGIDQVELEVLDEAEDLMGVDDDEVGWKDVVADGSMSDNEEEEDPSASGKRESLGNGSR